MGEFRNLHPITAPCGGDDCGLELAKAAKRIRDLELLLAELHDRTKSVWGDEADYLSSDLSAKIRKALSR